jgi:hypothetical protein
MEESHPQVLLINALSGYGHFEWSSSEAWILSYNGKGSLGPDCEQLLPCISASADSCLALADLRKGAPILGEGWLSARAREGLLGPMALPNLLLETFRFYIYYLELTIPAIQCTQKITDANRWKGGSGPFKNPAGLAINTWQAGQLPNPGQASPASRPPCCLPGTQHPAQEPSEAQVQPVYPIPLLQN